jgi:undecaprenyl-diphosphatase|tara:strand:- start:1003 stop:1770 length:768 start_codon:yes stop_codon:yes gene_type:complete
MISNYLEVLILSIVQGISEFLPVSSSAHLIVFSNIIDFSNKSLIFDVGLHLGSLLAILFYFRKELLNIRNDKKLFNLLLIGSIPLILFGYIFYSTGIINSFRNLKIIAWTTLIFGLLMYFADTFNIKKKIEKDLTIKNILIIGVMQILAVIPGVSRSGITITAGRFLNFDRHDSTKISFYLSIPALMGASVLSLKDVVNENIEFNFLLIISIILSFIFSYLTIKYFLIYTKKFSLKFFVIYRIILSIMIFLIIYN